MSYYKDVTKEIAVNMQELGKFIPDVMTAFSELVSSSSADGVLDKKTKELIFIAVAVANRCDGCIGFHTKKLVDAGGNGAGAGGSTGCGCCYGWRSVCDVRGKYD
ncbi:alkylhydroperoxidase AhpD family core domain [Morganella morganii]|nr:carboxymuconolactone decarboxylase family protein [Morganella morganii]VDY36378.1 alkylhydroperoxidase AhpD family core domain [Morganella morganii]